MKIAITGKGGVGKTTLSATLSRIYASEGRRVLAVDADPDANLAAAFGLSAEDVASIRPIAEMTGLIEERTGAKPGTPGGVFKLNPRVDDIPEECGFRFDNIVLIITGKSKEAASGCYCPENVFLRRLLKHLIVDRDEVVVIDMEAGIEHFTRGTAEAVDAFVVVVEPGKRSIQTALAVKGLARGLGVRHVFVVANKTRSEEDVDFIRNNIGDMTLVGALEFSHDVMEADIRGLPPYEAAGHLLEKTREIRDSIEKHIAGNRT
jgi:CO dehydrogenase maturation factor